MVTEALSMSRPQNRLLVRWSEPSPVMVDVWFNTMLARSAVTVLLPISLTVKSGTVLFTMPVPSVVVYSQPKIANNYHSGARGVKEL